MIDSLSLIVASELDHCCKDGLSYIDNNLDVNNMNIKNFRRLMIYTLKKIGVLPNPQKWFCKTPIFFRV
jgi:hypothetical protein